MQILNINVWGLTTMPPVGLYAGCSLKFCLPVFMNFLCFPVSRSAFESLSAFPRDFEILGWCPVGPVLPHGEKVPL